MKNKCLNMKRNKPYSKVNNDENQTYIMKKNSIHVSKGDRADEEPVEAKDLFNIQSTSDREI